MGDDKEIKVDLTVKDDELQGLRLPNPPEFSGDRKVDSVTVNDWVVLMRQHLLLRGLKTNSQKAVRFAALYLRGTALTWFHGHQDSLPKSYDKFAELLVASFAPIAATRLARDRLKRLYQRDSLEQYCDLFRRQALLVSDMSDTDKVERFVDGLQFGLRKSLSVYMLDRPKNDLELAIAAALTLNYEIRKDRPTNKASPAPSTQLKALDASTAESPRKCYKCGSTEHLRANCPLVRKGRGRKSGGQPKSKGQAGQSNA